MSLIGLGETLKITNSTKKDEGTYECHTSSKFQSEFSINRLTVFGMFVKHYYLKYKPLV